MTHAAPISKPAPADRPFVFANGPKSPVVRRWAERVWNAYPPAAMLLSAVLLAGCGQLGLTAAAPADDAQDARLAGNATAVPAPVAYPSELPLVGTAAARATVAHGKDRLEVANLSRLPWPGDGQARLWLNRRYGAPLPRLLPGKIARLSFADFLDADGNAFPTDNSSVVVEHIELVLGGDERTRVRFGLGY